MLGGGGGGGEGGSQNPLGEEIDAWGMPWDEWMLKPR